jgi:hypothetical protein
MSLGGLGPKANWLSVELVPVTCDCGSTCLWADGGIAEHGHAPRGPSCHTNYLRLFVMPAVEIGVDGDLVFVVSASERVVPARANAIRTM